MEACPNKDTRVSMNTGVEHTVMATAFSGIKAALATVLAGRKGVPRTGEGRDQVCVVPVLSFPRSPGVR